MEIEWISGLPFVTVANERMTSMTIGEVVEELIYIKKANEIQHPHDEAINNACNMLGKLPRNKSVYEWIQENSKLLK